MATVTVIASHCKEGSPPILSVRIETPKGVANLRWSCRLGRFIKCWGLMNLRRGQPKEHREADQFMKDFCASNGTFNRDIEK